MNTPEEKSLSESIEILQQTEKYKGLNYTQILAKMLLETDEESRKI